MSCIIAFFKLCKVIEKLGEDEMQEQVISPFFSVIIVNFNGGDYLQGAVDSLKRQNFQDFELFVVDNASSDTSMETLDVTGLDRVHLMPEAENHGFAKGNNLAAKLANGEWLVMLNPDAVADESWLEKIAGGIDKFPAIKMFASAQYSLDEPGIMDGAGDNYHVFGIPWRGGFGRSVSEMPNTGECFSPCGAGAVFHRQTFLDIGGFDESFFCYCEDVDLAFRLRLNGERCIFLHDAMIHHAGSALSDKVGDFALFHGTRNRVWVFLQNMPPIALFLFMPMHIIANLYIFARRGFEMTFIRAISASFKDYKSVMKRRKIVQASRKLGSLQIISMMTWNPRLLSNRLTDVREYTHK